MSPHGGIKSNDDNISHDNFLKTGDNNIMECINLGGNVTNFVENEASLDFLQQSHPHLGVQNLAPEAPHQQILTYNNFS